MYNGEKHFRKGIELLTEEKYSEALADFNRSLEIRPDDPDTLNNRGNTYDNLKRYEEALADYNRAIAKKPRYGLPLLARARLFSQQEELSSALDDLKQALKFFEEDHYTDGISLVQTWIAELEERIEEEKTKKLPPIEVQILRKISTSLRKTIDEDPLKRIRDREVTYEQYFQKERTIGTDSDSLVVLRRWSSFSPTLPNRRGEKNGGGYFLIWKGRGLVIDPGFDFMNNFDNAGYSIRDIDAVLLTHAHTDHTADLESLLSLIYELSERTGNEKKIDLFMNLGTVNKFIGWVSKLKGVGKIISLNAGDSISPNGYEWTLNVKAAKHHEIIGEHAVGLVFELNVGSNKSLKIGFTSDTSWSSQIQRQYTGCKLLILHIGSIGQNEFNEKLPLKSRKRLYHNHLGLIGVISIVKSLRPRLAVISEFGEELGTDRCQIARNLDRVFGEDRQCLTGDIVLSIRLPDISGYCDVCLDYQDYTQIKEMTHGTKERIVYHCQLHTPEEIVNKLHL